ncbi:MAG TPA: HEAT repeat domain-containing protein, partial [Planctomycetota bacterium]|nr:HEAT repeat domain-containing protein [Planctomycetota bacterium]
MKRCSFAVFSWFLLVLGSAATAQGEHGQDKPDAKPGIAWETSFDGALAKAKKENKPILIAFIMDGEPANDEVVQQHYTDAEVVKLSSQMVCLLGNIGSHGTDACAKFGGVTCEQHQDVEKKARAAYLKTDVVRAPQHVFCDKNGVELFRKVYLIAKQELRKAMAVAIAGASPAMAVDEATAERTRVDKLLKDADSHNAEVRDAAFSALATADDARALPALLDKARSGNDETSRCTAIKALGQKGNHAAIKPLLGFVGDKSTRVALFAVIALDQIRLPDPVPELLAQLKKEKDTRLRGRELCAVARCLPESVEVQKVCLAALQVT